MTVDKETALENLDKALDALTDLTKGHKSRGTATTKVEAMSGEGGSTQVHHTAKNSDPNGWAGSKASDVPENGASDAIDANGTDYNGRAKMRKSILAKLSKGQSLTAEEYDFVAKGSMVEDLDDKEDAKKAADCDDDAKEDKDEKKNPFAKSLEEHAADNEDVQKGLEVSEFLSGFAEVISKSLASAEARIVDKVVAAIANASDNSETFNKSLAGAVASLAEVTTLQAQRIEQVESTPARAPKSTGVAALEKSFDGDTGTGEDLSKSQVGEALFEMVQKGLIAPSEAIKFDTTNELSDVVAQAVHNYRTSR